MSGDERTRRARVVRLGQLAAEAEEQARAELHRADLRVSEADQRRADALRGAADLAERQLPIGLRAHLAGAGARHLAGLAGERVDLAAEADLARHRLAEAVVRVRSLDRLVERLDRAAADRRRQREAADLQDLVAIRAASRTRSSAVAGGGPGDRAVDGGAARAGSGRR